MLVQLWTMTQGCMPVLYQAKQKGKAFQNKIWTRFLVTSIVMSTALATTTIACTQGI